MLYEVIDAFLGLYFRYGIGVTSHLVLNSFKVCKETTESSFLGVLNAVFLVLCAPFRQTILFFNPTAT